jgi:hypothetical protein
LRSCYVHTRFESPGGSRKHIVVSVAVLGGFEKARNEAIFANNIKGELSAKANRKPIRDAQKPICARKKPIYAGPLGC